MSFYKEELEGETKNYIWARASAELAPPVEVMCKLAKEVVDSSICLDTMTSSDCELRATWEEFKQVSTFIALYRDVSCSYGNRAT